MLIQSFKQKNISYYMTVEGTILVMEVNRDHLGRKLGKLLGPFIPKASRCLLFELGSPYVVRGNQLNLPDLQAGSMQK